MPQLAPLICLYPGGQFEADGKGSICPIIQLIAELDEKYKTVAFGMFETMLTKKKFKDFF
jgi:hypothetical protein